VDFNSQHIVIVTNTANRTSIQIDQSKNKNVLIGTLTHAILWSQSPEEFQLLTTTAPLTDHRSPIAIAIAAPAYWQS
jgi:hypothetical protein